MHPSEPPKNKTLNNTNPLGAQGTPITYASALDGFWLQAKARGLSEETLTGYANVFNHFGKYIKKDILVTDITPLDIRGFLLAHSGRVSKKTLSNYYIALSALWTWLLKINLVDTHILKNIERPKPEKPDILPYSDQDIRSIFASLGRSKPYQRKYTLASHKLKYPHRHRAILFTLLDTGIRASELCHIRLHDVDLQNRKITIFGKGAKLRNVPISARTGQILWKYILTDRPDSRPNQPLFVSSIGEAFTRRQLHKRIKTICYRAGVKNATVHRFRHTFAINYLRNGGNIYSLQYILGHSSLEMVKRYLAIAQADVDKDHQNASPIAHWGL